MCLALMVAFPFPTKHIQYLSKDKQMPLKPPEEDLESFMHSSSHCACKKP